MKRFWEDDVTRETAEALGSRGRHARSRAAQSVRVRKGISLSVTLLALLSSAAMASSPEACLPAGNPADSAVGSGAGGFKAETALVPFTNTNPYADNFRLKVRPFVIGGRPIRIRQAWDERKSKVGLPHLLPGLKKIY